MGGPQHQESRMLAAFVPNEVMAAVEHVMDSLMEIHAADEGAEGSGEEGDEDGPSSSGAAAASSSSKASMT